MTEPQGVAHVVQILPEGDCLVSLSPPYQGLELVLVLPSIGQVWPSSDESAWSSPDFEPETALFTFERGAAVEEVVLQMGYALSEPRRRPDS